MEHKNNPFKVPENYFDNLSNRLEAESKRKHVSVSKVLKYVASISLILALSVSVFVVVFTGDKKEPLLSSNFFSIFSPNKEKEKDNVEKNLAKTSQIEWEKQVENLIAEVEQIQFTEEELDYLESFIDEDLNEYVFNNFENIE
ncbi:MAG: hypothetical protein UHE91_05785 [Bacteroidales bacterium]|jgi:hypothetical protein|nr:hypothetical protein [Bacteroidales bacterium]MBQ2397288.1 hypothetical protein [Bacteroidales bacterium]MBQ5872802.1 hypothetical protein [Bacteroidales bacterium]MBQ5891485.1 hypothetical protein [Bacteroidales bacterium]MED9962967.1 hypothetical protein [Bacteroidales bacterium]